MKYGVLLLAAAILASIASTVRADQNDVGAFASRTLSDANETFTKPTNLAALLLAGGASITLHNTDADKNVNDNFQHHRAFNDTTDKVFDYGGNPVTHLGLTGIWYLYSRSNDDNLNEQRACTMLSALTITDATAFSLKLIVHTERPNGDNFSFPSAHAASSFCAASVLDEFYGPGVGIPAYIGASLVGWRMVDAGDHWASDVLFGGTLGFIVGHSVAAKHKQLELAGFKIEPMIGLDAHQTTGVALVKRF
jgi:hypothetical protein